MNIKTVDLTDKLKEWARGKAKAHNKGKRFDSEVDKHDSVYIGYLGEGAFWCENKDSLHIDTSSYDFLLRGRKYEIKTWWSKCPPKQDYFLKIPSQDMDRIDLEAYYCFICVNPCGDMAWILGLISAVQFKDISVFRRCGEKQLGSGFIYTTDCHETQVRYLTHETPDQT